MKKLFLVPFLLLSFALASCATLDSLKSALTIGTASVNNPVTREQQAAVESSYQIAVSAALAYSRLRRCKAGETASIVNQCSQWTIVQKLKSANRIAYTQLVNLRRFMDNNQTINAIGAYNAVVAAIADFKSTAAASGI